jgi:Tfp pilus assembly protein PilX
MSDEPQSSGGFSKLGCLLTVLLVLLVLALIGFGMCSQM